MGSVVTDKSLVAICHNDRSDQIPPSTFALCPDDQVQRTSL